MEELLIRKVRMHELLYDMKSPNYRDQYMRQQAWEEIGKDLQVKAETAKNTWDKLRRCFLNAINRRRSKKSGHAVKNIPPWKFEYQMSFLLQFMTTRKKQNDVREEDSLDDSNYYEIFDAQGSENNVNEGNENPEQSYTDPLEEITHNIKEEVSQGQEILYTAAVDEMIPAIFNEEVSQSQEVSNKRRKRNICDIPIQEIAHATKAKSFEHSKYRERQTNEMDETDMFFLSMSKMTKKLPPLEQAKVKLQVSNAVLLAQIRINEEQQRQERSPSICSVSESTASYLANSPQRDPQIQLKHEIFDPGDET